MLHLSNADVLALVNSEDATHHAALSGVDLPALGASGPVVGVVYRYFLLQSESTPLHEDYLLNRLVLCHHQLVFVAELKLQVGAEDVQLALAPVLASPESLEEKTVLKGFLFVELLSNLFEVQEVQDKALDHLTAADVAVVRDRSAFRK